VECASSGICCTTRTVREDRCTGCQTVAPLLITPRTFWETQENFRARAFEAVRAFEAALVESAPVAEEVPAKGPCCHVRVIRRFYAIAQKAGLDVKNSERMKGAFSMALGRRVDSRKQLTADNWAYLGDLAESGRLVF